MSNVGQFFWSWKTISKFRKRKIKLFPRVHVLHKTRCGLASTAKKCTKFVMHLQTCCSVNLKLLLFCRSCCRRRSRCWSSFKSKAVKPQAFSFLHLLNQVCLLGVKDAEQDCICSYLGSISLPHLYPHFRTALFRLTVEIEFFNYNYLPNLSTFNHVIFLVVY